MHPGLQVFCCIAVTCNITSLEALLSCWCEAVCAVQVQLVHLVNQMAWPHTTTPLLHIHTSTPQELSIEPRESLSCEASGIY